MEAKFRVGDKVLDKSGQQWVIRHYRECEDGYYYGLYGKVDDVKESDLCFALPPEEYISEKVTPKFNEGDEIYFPVNNMFGKIQGIRELSEFSGYYYYVDFGNECLLLAENLLTNIYSPECPTLKEIKERAKQDLLLRDTPIKTETTPEYPLTKKECFNKFDNKTILDEAKEIVDGLRADDYYDPVKNFRDISVMASLMTGKTFSPSDCVKVLMAVKLTRESFKHKRDSLVDLCGYTYILDKIEES